MQYRVVSSARVPGSATDGVPQGKSGRLEPLRVKPSDARFLSTLRDWLRDALRLGVPQRTKHVVANSPRTVTGAMRVAVKPLGFAGAMSVRTAGQAIDCHPGTQSDECCH